LIYASFLTAYFVRFKVLTSIYPIAYGEFKGYSGSLLLIVVLWLAIFKLIGLYDNKKGQALIDETAQIILSVMVASFSLLGFLFLYRGLWFSRLLIVCAALVAIIFLVLLRILSFSINRILHVLGYNNQRILIVGSKEIGETLALRLKNDKSLGGIPVGFIDDDKIGSKEIPYLGKIDQIKSVVIANNIDEIVFASDNLPYQKMLDIITECESLKIKFKIVPGILEIIASRIEIDEVGGIPLITISEIGLKGINAFLKRSSDILFSAVLILLLSPIYLLISIIIKIDSKGPVFLIQERVGKDSKLFGMFKFRSMVVGAHEMQESLDPLSETEGHIFKMKNDPRVTRVGKWLRRLSLDEWPQLLNVLEGNMSLVGPRPPLPNEVEKYSPWHLKRLRVSPGITGLWQVSGRSLLPFEDMVRLDIYYIENWSLWFDIKILFKTIPTVLMAKGAY